MRQRKKMKTWKKILIWAASIILVLGVGGLFAANYVMDKMIAQLSASLENELLEEAVSPTQAPSGGTDYEPAAGEQGSDEGAQDGEEQSSDSQNEQSEQAGSSNSGSNSNKADSGSGSTDGYTAEITPDKAQDVQEKITATEKAKLASVFLKQLSMDDIKALQDLAGGGLDKAEKKEARDLILEKLTPEQYDDLIQIAKKYGMSQGRSYAEVSQEK